MSKLRSFLHMISFRVLFLICIFVPRVGSAKEVKIEWKALKHAIRYEIEIWLDKSIIDEKFTDDSSTGSKSIFKGNVDTTWWKGDLEPGKYSYQIRGIDRHKRFGHETSKKTLKVLAPSSPPPLPPPPPTPRLTQPKVRYDAGYVAISLMLSPYTYQVSSPSHGITGSTQSDAVVTRLSAEYWLSQWAVSGAVNLTQFSILDRNVAQPSVELLAKYRFNLFGNSGWSIFPKFGVELRDYPFVLPNTEFNFSQINVNDVFVYGPSMGVDIRKKVNDYFSIGAKLNYFIPVSIIGKSDTSDSINGPYSRRNISFGLQGLYWFSPRWGVGLGGYFEAKSLSYIATPSSKLDEEQVSLDASYFFGSLIFRLWK